MALLALLNHESDKKVGFDGFLVHIKIAPTKCRSNGTQEAKQARASNEKGYFLMVVQR